ncbi:MAG: InlB B-repeat-containing protein [Nitrososphaerota archaeon]|nr:InlB B-repeat-containing protein [Nitrososphaerota archaeon]
MTILFTDDFESRNFSTWTAVNVAVGTSIKVSDVWAHKGSHSALFENNGLNNVIMNLQKTIPASDEVFIRAYINFAQLSIVNTGYVNLFSLNTSGVNVMLAVRAVSGAYYFEIQYYDNGVATTLRSTTATLTAGTIRCVELHFKRGNGDGEINVYIDGVKVPDLAVMGIIRNTATTSVHLGSTWSQYSGVGNNFKIYFDDVMVSDQYIGGTDEPITSTYTVVYNVNGATGGSIPIDSATYTSGNVVIVRANTGRLARTGYTFKGWDTNANSTASTYVVTDNTVTPSTFIMGKTGDVILYAIWQKNPSEPIDSNIIRYQVTTGETLGWIAQKFGTTTATLRSLNGLSNDNIPTGQQLQIPVGALPVMDAEFYKYWRMSIPTGEQLTPTILQQQVYRAWWYPGVGDFEGYLMLQTPREGGNVSTLGSTAIRVEFRENLYNQNDLGHDWGLYGYHKMTYEAKAYVVNANPGGRNAARNWTDTGQFWGYSGGSPCMFELAYGPAPIETKSTTFRWRHACVEGIINYGVGTVVPIGTPYTATFECAGGVMRVWMESPVAGIAKTLFYESASPAPPDSNSYHFQVGNYDASSNATGAVPNPMDVHTLIGYKYIKIEHNPIRGRLTYSNGSPITGQTVNYVVNGGGVSNLAFSVVTDTNGYYYIPYVPSQGGVNCAAVNITVPTITGCTSNKTGTINVPATPVTDITGIRSGSTYDIVYTSNTSPPKFLVIYNANWSDGVAGTGTIPVDSDRYTTGSTVTVHANTGGLAKSGYTFLGWTTSASDVSPAYVVNGNTVTPSTVTMKTADVTLYAVWELIPVYAVTYDGNGSTGGSVPVDSGVYSVGASVVVCVNAGGLVKPGFVFKGWATDASAVTPTYTVAESTVTPSAFSMGSAKVTLYAVWELITTYTVTYDGNGSTSGSVPIDNIAYTTGSTVMVLAGTGNLVKSDHTFLGWAFNSSAVAPNFAFSGTSIIPSSFTMGSDNIILYAVWRVGHIEENQSIFKEYIDNHSTVLSNCDSLTGWSKSTSGNMTLETAIKKEGASSVKLETSSTAQVFAQLSGFSADLSDKFIMLSLYIEDTTKLGTGSVGFLVSNVSAYSKYALFNYPLNGLSAGWNNLSLPITKSTMDYGRWQYSGGFTESDWTSITSLRVRIFSATEGVSTFVCMADVRVVSSAFPNGVVTFSFDDSNESVYSKAKPLFDIYGYAATVFIMPSNIGTPPYITLENLKTLQNEGWDICSHIVNLPDLTLLTETEVIKQLTKNKQWLLTNGFTKNNYFSANTLYPASNYHNISRPYAAPYETLPPCYESRVRCYSTNNKTTATEMIDAIENVRSNGSWVIFNIRNITDSNLSADSMMLQSTLQVVLEYCNANGVAVKTFNEIYNYFANYNPPNPT